MVTKDLEAAVKALALASAEERQRREELREALGAPASAHIYVWERGVNVDWGLLDIKAPIPFSALPDDAQPSIAKGGGTSGEIELRWQWSPCESLTVTATTRHPAAEAYRIMAARSSALVRAERT